MLFLDPPPHLHIHKRVMSSFFIALLRPLMATLAEHLDVDMLGVFLALEYEWWAPLSGRCPLLGCLWFFFIYNYLLHSLKLRVDS